MVEGRDQSGLDGVDTDREHDGDLRRCALGRPRWPLAAGRCYYCNPHIYNLCGERRQSFIVTVRRTVFVRHVPPDEIPSLLQSFKESGHKCRSFIWRGGTEIADHRHRRRRAGCERQGGCSGSNPDDPPPLHSIASSASASSLSGMVRPRTWAVLRLMTRSNLVGCSTGISLGFVPRSILLTNSAARRNRSGKFGP